MAPSRRRSNARADSPALSATSRLHCLIEWLRSGRRLTTALAADSFGVSRRTIMRDIRHLRTALCLAVRYDPAEGTYALGEGHAALPFIPHPDLVPGILNAVTRPKSVDCEGMVHLRFSPRSVQAYTVGNGLGTLKDITDSEGHLDLYYETRDLDNLIRWVLSSGAEVEVIAPESLRCRIVMEIRRMLDVYQPRPGGVA